MRSFHGLRYCFHLLGMFLLTAALALADNPPAPRISKETREELIHAFNQELVYIRTNFPMGKIGLKLKNGNVLLSGDELKHLMALWGPAAKPGDRARISDVFIKDDHIRFEINGGPVKKQKWYQHIPGSGRRFIYAHLAVGFFGERAWLFRGSLLRQIRSGHYRTGAEAIAASSV